MCGKCVSFPFFYQGTTMETLLRTVICKTSGVFPVGVERAYTFLDFSPGPLKVGEKKKRKKNPLNGRDPSWWTCSAELLFHALLRPSHHPCWITHPTVLFQGFTPPSTPAAVKRLCSARSPQAH